MRSFFLSSREENEKKIEGSWRGEFGWNPGKMEGKLGEVLGGSEKFGKICKILIFVSTKCVNPRKEPKIHENHGKSRKKTQGIIGISQKCTENRESSTNDARKSSRPSEGIGKMGKLTGIHGKCLQIGGKYRKLAYKPQWMTEKNEQITKYSVKMTSQHNWRRVQCTALEFQAWFPSSLQAFGWKIIFHRLIFALKPLFKLKLNTRPHIVTSYAPWMLFISFSIHLIRPHNGYKFVDANFFRFGLGSSYAAVLNQHKTSRKTQHKSSKRRMNTIGKSTIYAPLLYVCNCAYVHVCLWHYSTNEVTIAATF